MKKSFSRGNDALAVGALDAGLAFYSGYPITPQNEIPEFLSAELPKRGGVFVQAESELAAVNMLIGASSCGVRCMTTSSSPGISLMQEGISFLAGSELPSVIVNVCRWGPGLGGIGPSQGDYNQAVKGGGHGDYFAPVLAPYSVQEMYDLVGKAFDLADKYRTPAFVLSDAMIGLMKEPYTRHKPEPIKRDLPDWAIGDRARGDQKIVKSLFLKGNFLEKLNWKLYEKHQQMIREDVLFENYRCDDAEIIIVAFGMMARIARSVVDAGRDAGLRIGLFRPITLRPWPEKQLEATTAHCRNYMVMEMNTGQMVDDVRRVLGKDVNIGFYGKPSAYPPTPDELLASVKEQMER